MSGTLIEDSDQADRTALHGFRIGRAECYRLQPPDQVVLAAEKRLAAGQASPGNSPEDVSGWLIAVHALPSDDYTNSCLKDERTTRYWAAWEQAIHSATTMVLGSANHDDRAFCTIVPGEALTNVLDAEIATAEAQLLERALTALERAGIDRKLVLLGIATENQSGAWPAPLAIHLGAAQDLGAATILHEMGRRLTEMTTIQCRALVRPDERCPACNSSRYGIRSPEQGEDGRYTAHDRCMDCDYAEPRSTPT